MSPLANGLLHIVRDGQDLSVRQLVVLFAVGGNDVQPTIRHLAAHMKVSKPAITRAVDRLQSLGWAQREVDQADRRSVIVRLTEEGRTAAVRFERGASGLVREAA